MSKYICVNAGHAQCQENCEHGKPHEPFSEDGALLDICDQETVPCGSIGLLVICQEIKEEQP